MYPRPCRRFFTTSFEGASSSGGSTFLISFSRTCNTNSSTDSYPQASAHFWAFSSKSPSIFILCDPNNGCLQHHLNFAEQRSTPSLRSLRSFPAFDLKALNREDRKEQPQSSQRKSALLRSAAICQRIQTLTVPS